MKYEKPSMEVLEMMNLFTTEEDSICSDEFTWPSPDCPNETGMNTDF